MHAHWLIRFLAVSVAIVLVSSVMTPPGEALDHPTQEQISALDHLLAIASQQVPLELTLESLLAATPDDAPDTDGDGIPDPVEAVLGINPELADSDGDQLDDAYELMNGLNPSDLDSNHDGLPDNLELEGPADLDGDGAANEWDDDNDNDGVRDGLDLAPNALSGVAASYTIDVATTGKPTYVDFQVRPADPTHLTLAASEWDWPWDDEGTIRDLLAQAEGETADVTIVPMLQLHADGGPDPAEGEPYGIVTLPPNEAAGEPPDSFKALVPLTPVVDSGTTVAFSGRMFYPEGASPGMMTAELVWMVTGPVDSYSSTVFVAGFSQALKDGLLYYSAWPPSPERVDLFSQPEAGGYTPKEGGCALESVTETSIATSDAALEFRCEGPLSGGATFEPGDNFTAPFELPENELMGALFWGSISEVPVEEHTTIIARYREDFTFTGLEGTENLEVEVGVVYGEDHEQVIGAGLVLDYEYLRSQNSLNEAFAQFGSLGLSEMHTVTQSVSHFDEALMTATEALPGAFEGVAPVFTIVGERSTTRGPVEWNDDMALQTTTELTLDLRDPVFAVTTKTMALDWYDQSNETALGPEYMAELERWNLPSDVLDSVALLTLIWRGGETHVTNVGGASELFQKPEWTTLAEAIEAGTILADVGTIGVALDVSIGNWKFLKGVSDLVSKGWSVSFKGMNLGAVDKLELGLGNVWGVFAADKTPLTKLTRFGKAMKGLSKVGKAAEVVGLVVGVVMWGVIWHDVGGWEGFVQGFGAFSLYALTSLAFYVLGSLSAVCLATVGVGCVVAGAAGIILAAVGAVVLLLDWLFGWGWWEKVEAWWNSLWTEQQIQLVELDFDYTRYPDLLLDDLDDNGFDVGDVIRLQAGIKRTHKAHRGGTRASHMWHSGIFPGLVADACAVAADGSLSCLPSDACTGRPGESSCTGDLAEITGTRTDVETIFEPEAIWDYVESNYSPDLDLRCDQMQDGNVAACWIFVDSLLEVRATPMTETVDFKLEVGMAYDGQTAVWHDEPWWDQDWVGYTPISDDGTSDMNTLHFDVLPGGIGDFVEWPVISVLDADFDGVVGDADPDPFDADFDNDGLPDGFEVTIGTNPAMADTDSDGVGDGEELRLRTDPTEGDTDSDGLFDGEEAAGWTIQFSYSGQLFATHVTSDPLLSKSDGDEIGDFDERRRGLNPRSSDTNGDGFLDSLNAPPVATDDTFATDEDTLLEVGSPGMLAGDTDPDGDPLIVKDVNTATTLGSVSATSDGGFSYDPDGVFDWLANGETAFDAFSYRVSDNRGGEASAAVTIEIQGRNDAPQFDTVTVPATIGEGQLFAVEAVFTGVDRSDTHTATVDWGDGAPVAQIEVGAGEGALSATHSYREDRVEPYQITVTVADTAGANDSRSSAVQVTNVAPTVSGLVATPIDEGGRTTLSGTITDPGVEDALTLEVDWADGSLPETASYPPDTGSFTLDHIYRDDNPTGTPSDVSVIEVTMTDDDGGTYSTIGEVSVTNVAPVLSIDRIADGRTFTPVGIAVRIEASFTDVGLDDTHAATIDWGDSSQTDLGNVTAGAISGAHVYTMPGSYLAAVTVTDDDLGDATVDDILIQVLELDAATEAVAIQLATALDGSDPATAQAVKKAIDELIGNNGGKADNGAVDKLMSGDLVAALVKLAEAEANLESVTGVDLTPQQIMLANIARSVAEGTASRAHEITGCVDPTAPTCSKGDNKKITEIDAALEAGVQALQEGRYAVAIASFTDVVRKALGLIG